MLVALAGLVLTAGLGASPASATETALCKNGTSVPYCPSGSRYPANTTLSGATSKLLVATSVLDFECKSELTAKSTSESGNPLPLSVSGWSFTNRQGEGGVKCTVEAKNLSYAGSLAHSEGANGTLTLSSGGSGEPRLYAKCGSFIQCEWTAPGMEVRGGSGSAEIRIPKASLAKKTGNVCPSSSTVETTSFALSSPSSVWVTRAESPPPPATAMCKTLEGWCSPENIYGKGALLNGETSDFLIETPSGYVPGDISCKEATISATTAAAYGEPLGLSDTEFTQGKCEWGFGGCTLKFLQNPNKGSISKYNADGLWKGLGASWELKCGSYVGCTFTMPSGSTITIQHGTPGAIKINSSLTVTGSQTCPQSANLTATYPLNFTEGLFFTDALR